MFFKKKSSLPTETTHILSDENPIYILGDDDLALFLAAKLQENGQNCYILTTKAPTIGTKNLEITLKEDYNLQKNTFILPTTSMTTKSPTAILIACRSNSLRSHLTLLPSSRYKDTPVICFNIMEDFKQLSPILGTSFYKAYFNGYLSRSGTNLTACGMAPEIILSAEKEEGSTNPAEQILNLTQIKVTLHNKDIANFWKTNASQILGYLVSSPKLHIMELLNHKEKKEIITKAAKELCQLAKYEKVKISSDEIIRELIDTPRNYYYKDSSLSKIENAARLEKLYNMLSEKARIYKYKIPQLNLYIKENYEYLLRK